MPVFVIHGAMMPKPHPNTRAGFSAALGAGRRLRLVEGSGHNQSLHAGAVWSEIEDWIDSVLPEE